MGSEGSWKGSLSYVRSQHCNRPTSHYTYYLKGEIIAKDRKKRKVQKEKKGKSISTFIYLNFKKKKKRLGQMEIKS